MRRDLVPAQSCLRSNAKRDDQRPSRFDCFRWSRLGSELRPVLALQCRDDFAAELIGIFITQRLLM